MTKFILKSIGCLLLLAASLEANGQQHSIKLSGGLLYTNVASESNWFATVLPLTVANVTGEDYTYPWRPGGWVTVECVLSSGRLFQLDLGLTYQERPPLEVFAFPAGAQGGVAATHVLGSWPSNPRHPLFNDPGHTFWRFPNFRYLHLELMPSFKYGVDRISLLAGIGFFGGRLLNRAETTRELDDFGSIADHLRARGVLDNVRYTVTDLGLLPKLEVRYAISERLSVGLLLKHYWSVYRLNDTLVSDFDWRHNVRWRVFAGGLSAQYTVGKVRQVSGF